MENIVGHPVNSHFARVFQEIVASTKEPGVISSPLSIYICLGMLAEGLSGPTFTQLKDALGFGPSTNVVDASITGAIAKLSMSKNKSAVVKMSNAIYTGKAFPIKAPWVQTLQTKFQATAKSVDFSLAATTEQINAAISEATNGLLKNTLSQLGADTVAVLLNTIYFKGIWAQPFQKTSTHKRPFHLANGTQTQVDFMSNSKLKVAIQKTGPLWYMAIPYEGGNIKFVVEMAAKHDTLNPTVPSDVLKIAKNPAVAETVVNLPKFKAELKSELSSIFKKMGVTGIFQGGADFHKISDEAVMVSSIIHHAFVVVDEEGTEAAAATAVIMSKGAVFKKEVKEFEVNKPFHFHIVDTVSGLILFSGTIHKPTF